MELNYKILDKIRTEIGDSFYFLHLNKFKNNFEEFISTFESFYPKVNVGYSYKTNYTPAICEIVNELGGFAEVVSEMEYDLALKVGVKPKDIIVNGPYKTKTALEKFFLKGSLVNLDSFREANTLFAIVNDNPGAIFRVGLRCNFDIQNESISRFGFDSDTAEFEALVTKLNENSQIELEGFHCHFPDRNLQSYQHRVEGMLDVLDRLSANPPKFIDLGGGYFGKMHEELAKQFGNVHSYHEYAEIIGSALSKKYINLPPEKWPLLILEPGSALVADTMDFVSSVIDIKNIRGQYIAMSSGSKFNIGLLTSSVQMPMEVFSSENSTNFTNIDVSGFTCIESDYLYKNYAGVLGVNSFLHFSNVGSYSIVFKPPFIMPNVPVISISQLEPLEYQIVKKQETMSDIFATYNFGGMICQVKSS